MYNILSLKMDPIIIAAIIGAIATIIAAIISAALGKKSRKEVEKKTVAPKPNYQLLSDAYRLGCGVSWLVGVYTFNLQEFKTKVDANRNTILRLATKVLPPERFPYVHSLMQKVFTSGNSQTANELHEKIVNAIFDTYPPAIQVAYVFGVYIPILTCIPDSQMDFVLSKVLCVLQPLQGTVYKASNTFPKDFVKWYEDILAKRNVRSAASRIDNWFISLK